MAHFLVYVAVQKGIVRRSSLEVLTHARALAREQGGRVEALLVGSDPGASVEVVRRYGPERIYTVEHPVFERHVNTPLIDALAAAVESSGAEVVCFASTEAVKDVLGALAVRVGGTALPDVASFTWTGDAVEALRPVMAAKFLARVRAAARPVLVSVRSGSYDATEAPGEAEVVALPFTFDAGSLKQQVEEAENAADAGADLSEARVVVAAGRGIRDESGKQLVEELAGVLGAAIGSSRAVVESGLFPATTQVGQTGKVVAPDLYLAVGISGAIQHVAGMANSRVIVAINRDADAPIFDVATYGLVGDLHRILPPLIEELRRRKGA